MQKKLFTITIITLIILSSTIFTNVVFPESVAEPAKLKIYIGPASVLADNNTYNCIFVQLQDSNGKPARALQDTTISLSSSLTNIGTVDPSITIPKGSTFASANFNSTFTPGTTAIAATATGFATVQSSITTIGPIPSAVAVYGFPSTLPADGGAYPAIMVQLQDSSGSPAKAPKEGIQVTLSCSDTTVGIVTPSVTILGGKTYAIATFTTTTKAETEAKPQSAIITAVSQGYASKQVTITTTPIASNPNQLKIFLGPAQVLADQNSYRQIAIELQNATGYTAVAQSDVTITVASSDQSIGKVDPEITITQSKTYALATLNTTYKAGTTTITAVATNLLREQQTITTTGFTPSKLAVYCVPSIVPSDNSTYETIQVQLQDSTGRPAKDPETDVNVNLFSSQPTVGTVSSILTIPFGKTQATGTFTVTNAPGSTTITAQASSYITGLATITTYLIDYSPLQMTVTTNQQNINNGDQTEIIAYITADGAPITSAIVQFTSNNGGTFATTKEQGGGYYNTTFTAPSFTKTTTCTVTARGSKTGYIDTQATTQITVAPTSTPTPTPSSTPTPTPTATPTQTPTSNNTGTIQLCIKNSEDNPLNDTIVSSIAQPAGTPTLFDITNATGYVTFKNATAGSYIFSIIKQGYAPMNATIDFTGQPMALTLTLLGGNTQADYTLIIIISIMVTAIVIAAISALFLIRHRKAARFKALQQLQKQMKNKY